MNEVDKLLFEDVKLYTNLGTDSTQEEREAVRHKSKRIYNKIKKLDPELGQFLLNAIDE